MSMLFRLEDGSIYTRGNRDVGYMIPDICLPCINLQEINQYIAGEVRKQVNGCKNRNLLSYSKSLGVCLLKYNRLGDDELHICNIPLDHWMNTVSFNRLEGNDIQQIEVYPYDIYNRCSAQCFMNDSKVKILNFCIDISDDVALNNYLLKYTETNKKWFARPEKDAEVIIMQPYNDEFIIRDYIDEVYLLYGLNQYYGFLRTEEIVQILVSEISQLSNNYFWNNDKELDAIIQIIYYLHFCGTQEYEISEAIYNTYLKEYKGYISVFSDPKMMYKYIMDDNFDENYCKEDKIEELIDDMKTYYTTRVSEIIISNFEKTLI